MAPAEWWCDEAKSFFLNPLKDWARGRSERIHGLPGVEPKNPLVVAGVLVKGRRGFQHFAEVRKWEKRGAKKNT